MNEIFKENQIAFIDISPVERIHFYDYTVVRLILKYNEN